jgi:hypothetical protein
MPAQLFPPQPLVKCFLETDTNVAYRVLGGFQLKLRDRMAGIDANLDDLQAGIEAASRAAHTLHTDTRKFNGLLNTPVLRAVVRHVKDLQACARDQAAAIEELREGIARLQEELKQSNGAVRPPSLMDAGRQE